MIQTPVFARRSLSLWLRPAPWWLAAALAALMLGLARPAVDRFDLLVHDVLAREVVAPLRGPAAPADSIIVAIDDASLQALGRWPWPRQRHAELIDVLRQAGTQAVGYNVLFSESSADPADDERLAAAIAAHGQIVLPVAPAKQPGDGRPAVLKPLPALEKSAAALGHAETPIDADGQMRRVALVAGSDANAWDALALAVQRVTSAQSGGPASAMTAAQRQQHAQEPWWHDQLRLMPPATSVTSPIPQVSEIGRASCRERVSLNV